MGYFPNGTSGTVYEEQYCYKCVNWKDNGSGSEGCPIMDLHNFWNYEACNGKDAPKDSDKNAKFEALEHFIPHTKDGLGCDECSMFHPTAAAEKEMVVDKTDALKEWEALYGRRTE